MATYYSDKVLIDPTGATTQNTIQPKFLETGDTTVVATYTVPTGQPLFAAGDTIQLLDIPAAVRVTEIQLETQKIDSSGTPALLLSIGDTVLATRFYNAINTAQAGGYAAQTQTGILGYAYAVRTRILATIGTSAAAAPTAGNKLVFVITYNTDP